jgi:hypothetical protein
MELRGELHGNPPGHSKNLWSAKKHDISLWKRFHPIREVIRHATLEPVARMGRFASL